MEKQTDTEMETETETETKTETETETEKRTEIETSVGWGVMVPCAIVDAMTDTKFWCVNTTPFGIPVEPEVYMIIAMSCEIGATALRSTYAAGEPGTTLRQSQVK